jgi:hemolysin activation/secretion protein
MMNRLMLAYDDRDSPDIPRQGGLYRFFGGISDRRFISSSSYNQIGADAHNYLPIGSRVTLASHAFLQYTPAGVETPFWAMGRLGGEDSLLTDQQTLRGYGAGRFVDNNLFVLNVEARTRVYERNIFDTHGVVELAPFFEAGNVFHDFDDSPINHLHPVGGVGVRGIAEPFVVGYVDVGFGGEGASIFSGVNYPF